MPAGGGGSNRRWYSFTAGGVCIVTSYIYSPATPTCINGFTLCAIYAIYATSSPSVISSRLCSYIAALLATGVPQPSGVGQKPYVYGKVL